jgi:serine/threonine protein phosphatase PrpC
MNPILLSVQGNPENQDRGVVVRDGPRLVLCVADGAGGRSGGTEAAVMTVQFVRENAHGIQGAESCADLLRRLDAAIAEDKVAGETTCALAVVTPREIFGASVGDSGVWFIPKDGDRPIDLTHGQQRKPFLGTGQAWPVPFQSDARSGWLLLATDGLLKYTSSEPIVQVCMGHPVEAAAQRLIDVVTYPSGTRPDDVTVILTDLPEPPLSNDRNKT